MLYLIQLIDSAPLDPPRVFADAASARQVFIALVREHRATAYADYCALNQVDPGAFDSARAFAAGDADSMRFCYWELRPEESASAEPRPPAVLPKREQVLQAAAETQQQSLGVQTELRSLTEKLTGLSQELIQLQTLLADEGEEAVAVESCEPSEPAPQVIDEKYQSAEWQDFVQALIRMCGGTWGEFPLLSRQDWRQAVYGNLTELPYWEWAAITIDQAIERARGGGYVVEEDREQAGHFAYISPAGERSETLYEQEDLAWCAAGLHAAGEDGAEG